MVNKRFTIIYSFRALWIILAIILFFYVISQNIFTKRSLLYNLNFTHSISRDINGWYPTSRTQYQAESASLLIKAQPVYLRAYLPVDFQTLTVKGSQNANLPVRLGLKQSDGSWFYKEVPAGDFVLSYDLTSAYLYRRSLELMISAPTWSATSTATLANNWQLLLER